MPSQNPAYPHTDKLEARFIKDIQERGITHTLTWIDQWFEAEARAYIDDQVEQAMSSMHGEWTNAHAKQEVRHLFELTTAHDCMAGRDPFRQSSSVGATARERALLSAGLHIIKNSPVQIQAVPGVVLREGQPVLVSEKDIKPTDVRLGVQAPQQGSMRERLWARIAELRDKHFVPDASENEANGNSRPRER